MVNVFVTAPEYDKAPGVFRGASSMGLVCIRGPSDEAQLAQAIRERAGRHVRPSW